MQQDRQILVGIDQRDHPADLLQRRRQCFGILVQQAVRQPHDVAVAHLFRQFVQRAGGLAVIGRPADGGYLVEVSDNGEGVSEEDQKQIFEKFAKARNRNTGRPSGSGLGLTISRHIVEHHRGRIWVRSTPGHGATFCVFLTEADAGDDAPALAPDLAGVK